MGALILGAAKRRLSWDLVRQAAESTAKLSAFVVFILIGARVFSLTFYGVSGHVWVEHLLTSLPGGLLTKVGVYAIIRTQTLLFPEGRLDDVLMWLALATMVVGILGAVALFASMANIVSGFLITDRMLKMFKTDNREKH